MLDIIKFIIIIISTIIVCFIVYFISLKIVNKKHQKRVKEHATLYNLISNQNFEIEARLCHEQQKYDLMNKIDAIAEEIKYAPKFQKAELIDKLEKEKQELWFIKNIISDEKRKEKSYAKQIQEYISTHKIDAKKWGL